MTEQLSMNGEQELAMTLVERFRRAWQDFRPVPIEDLLRTFRETFPAAEADPGRNLALQLVKIDMEERWRNSGPTGRGQPSGSGVAELRLLETYLPTLCSVSIDESRLLELLVYEYQLRHSCGERPRLDEYASRLHQLSEAMRTFDDAQRLVETTVHSAGPECDRFETVVRATDSRDPMQAASRPEQYDVAHSLARVLAQVRPFSELSQHEREALALHTTIREFEAGEVLFRQGDPTDCLLVVLDGEVEVCVVEAGVPHSIARLEKHAVVGEIGLLTREARSADVTAIQHGKAAIIPKEKFDHLVGTQPRFSIALAELVAERIGTRTIDVLYGKTIDRYRIQQRLGRGAMGVIYAAMHVTSGREVAVKMLRHDLVSDRSALERFHQEAEIVKGLNHPNIVRVFDEFSAFGTCFIVMDLCDGVPLSQFIKSAGPLSEDMVRGIIGQIAAALSHAHAAGVAHRDLKPSNVMVCRDGTVRLTDFGLARCPLNDSRLTMVSQVVGTPMYMAPEQLLGERGDERSDLYSFGIVLFELVAGRVPFESRQFDDLRCERLVWSLPPADEIRAGFDSQTYDVLKTCLEKNPSHRTVCLQKLSQWAAPIDWAELPDGIFNTVGQAEPAIEFEPSARRH
jgi:CRP-like cAMP-binding protein